MFDLNSHALRPDGWTSADAAGLPILAGLVRYEEVQAGAINHAIRFTAPRTRRSYIWPARHQAGASDDPALPPMGQRFRLKASFDISSFSPEVQVILTALKTYGMILADNGSSWYISGAPDERWNNDVLAELKTLQGSDFEAVDTSALMIDPDSGQAGQETKRVTPGSAYTGQQIGYTIQVIAGTSAISLTNPLPSELSLVEGSLVTDPPSVPPAISSGGSINWSRDASSSAVHVTISYSATLSTSETRAILNTTHVWRGEQQRLLTALLLANPRRVYLPAIYRSY